MAAESLLGGQAQDIITKADVKETIDFALAGATSAQVQTGPNDSKIITGTNPNTALSGVAEKQTLVVAQQSAVSVQVENGVAKIDVTLPANTSVGAKSLDVAVTPKQAEQFLHSLLEQEIPKATADPAEQQARAAVEKAINTATQVLEKQGITQAVVSVVKVAADPGSSGGELVIQGQADQHELMVVALPESAAGTKVVLENTEAASIVGSGTVEVKQAAIVTGDLSNQQILGSSGADTLIGGGGSDTLVGGGGSDTFGLNAAGNYTVEMGKDDKIAFLIDGVTSLEQLSQIITGTQEQGGNLTVYFAGGSSITFVGLSAADITADMVTFGL
jgi:Ca2+-binding RTX toxin-like protein